MELLEGASEWAGRRKENSKSQRFSVRFSFLERLLVYRRKFTLISPAGLVNPFRTQIRRERLEVASMDVGGKIPGLVHKGGSKAMEARARSGAGRDLSFTFFVSEVFFGVAGEDLKEIQ